MITADPPVAAPALSQTIANASRILLLSHINPDGDAIGSLLAMWHTLHGMNKIVEAFAFPNLPHFVMALPGIANVRIYSHQMALPDVDLVIMLDTAEINRVGPIYIEHPALHQIPLVIIDHHQTNVGQGTINLVDAHAASCTQLLYRLLCAMDVPITPTIATCLLMGVMSDTGGFRTNNTTPQSMQISAELLLAGADHEMITRELYRTVPMSSIVVMGHALTYLRVEDGIVWTHLTQEMLHQSDADITAADEIVVMLQRVAGNRICLLLREVGPQETKISLRSTPDINVAAVAQTWGGGGHKQAAGATIPLPIPQAETVVLQRLRETLAAMEDGNM